MKFDIVKYIDDVCQSYFRGGCTKAYALGEIKFALEENSWPMLCDGKEMIGSTVKANDTTWNIHPDWCIEDNEEEDK